MGPLHSLNVQSYFEVVDFVLFIWYQKISQLMFLIDRRQMKSQLAIGSIERPVDQLLASECRQ